MSDPIEVTTRYATTVDTLAAAWAFVMERIDMVGPDPSVEISPCRRRYEDGDYPVTRFDVVVWGMVEEGL